MAHRRAPLWAGIVAAWGAFIIAAAPLFAQTAAPQARRAPTEVYTVSGIAVEKTAATAAAARSEAIAEGQRQAFQRLIRRLVAGGGAERVPTPAASRLSELVQDFEVADEKVSSSRYSAKVTVRFKPEPIRAMLRADNLAFTETASRPVLVVPVYESGSRSTLWDDPNPWREAWNARLPRDGLVPFVMPAGELQDLSSLNAEQAKALDEGRIKALAARYGALDGIVAVARAAEGGSEMQVTVSRVGAAAPPSTLVERLKANPGESAAALLGRAVDAVANQVEDRWKQDNAVRSGREQTLEAVVPLGGLKDWVEVRARLARVGAVRRSELRALSRHEARVSLLYVGEPSQLATALAQAELRLEGQPPNHVLRLAGASQGSE
ncbi:MAG: DUF2066 domain-containing protein [Alphaproteobacteria bacterium]